MTTPTDSKPSDSNDKLLILGCHLSIFLCVGLLFSLVVFLIKKEDPVAKHAKETLNFFITLFICMVALSIVGAILGHVLWILGMLVSLVQLAIVLGAMVCCVLGAKKASEGGFYEYPVNFRLIK